MKKFWIALLLLALLGSMLPVQAAGDAMQPDSLRDLINSETLYPQKSGYPQVDAILEEIFAPYAESDNYTKLKAAYDWTVTEINYSWAPYSQNWAPAYDCFVPVYDLAYPAGLEEVIPFEMINRSYHALTRHEGICYDYGVLFAVMARYLGFEAYVHTGYFVFEEGYCTGSGHHGWAEVVLDGEYYIFDPQRDYRMSANGTEEIPYLYFGIDEDHAWRYDHETAVNAARDAQFLPVNAVRHALVRAFATSAGAAQGTGRYALGETVTVSATGLRAFRGWYDASGSLVSAEPEYSFVLTAPATLRAVFDGQYFEDVMGQWYAADANAAYDSGLVEGTAPFRFDGQTTMSRAMALTVLYRMAQPETAAEDAGYADVSAESWYADAVNWGTELGIVEGVGDGCFAPNAPVTREQFVTMMMRWKGEGETEALSYTDLEQVSDYAQPWLEQAQAMELLTGYEDGTLRPRSELTRAEAVALALRLLRCLEN